MQPATHQIQAALETHPNWRFLSKTKLLVALRTSGLTVTKKDVDAWFSSREDTVVQELFARPKKRFKYARIAAPPWSFQIDVVRMDRYKSQNRGVDRFLLLVEISSRKAFAYALKSETVADVLKAYKRFLKDADHEPFLVQGDDYFSAKEFVAYNDKKNIPVVTGVAAEEHVTTGDPLGILDRLVQTLRAVMEKRIHTDDDPKWPAFLDEVIQDYNATAHETLKNKTPDQVYDSLPLIHARWVEDSAYNAEVSKDVSEHFKVGDYVRKRLKKGTFEKGSTQTMSLEVYRVTKVKGTRVSLETYPDGDKVPRAAKPNELLKVDKPHNAPAPVTVEKAVKEGRASRRLAKEGISVNAPKKTPKESDSEKGIYKLLQTGQLAVVDAEDAPDDDPHRLTLKHKGKTGYVYAGLVTKATAKKVYLKPLQGKSLDAKKLKLSDASVALDGKSHADALLYAGEAPRRRSDGTMSLAPDVLATVKAEYVFTQ